MLQDKTGMAAVVSSGDRLATLRAARDVIAEEIDRIRVSSKHMETPGRDIVAMTKELSRVMAEIAELGGEEETSEVDELAKRRVARRSNAAGA